MLIEYLDCLILIEALKFTLLYLRGLILISRFKINNKAWGIWILHSRFQIENPKNVIDEIELVNRKLIFC